MLRALLYLRLTSLRNWTLSRVRRLRQPKYLAGAIVGAAYFYFFFVHGLAGPRPRRMLPEGAAATPEALRVAESLLPGDWLPVVSAIGALALLAIAALMWMVPTKPAALGFTEAEIAFLFPAPVTRRKLIHFRLVSSQLGSLVAAGVMVLFSQRWTFVGGNVLTHALGWWFLFSGLNLHLTGAKFTLTRLAEQGFGTWRRRLLLGTAVLGLLGATFARIPASERLPALAETFSLQPIVGWLVTLANTAPLEWVLWPFRLVLAPFLAGDSRAFLLAVGPALAVLVLHYLWVVSTAVAFEEASIEQAETRAARLAAWRAGNQGANRAGTKPRAAPFRLAASGRPEVAFLWKNLLSTWPYFTPRVFAGCAFVIAAGCTWLKSQPEWRGLLPGLGAMALVFAGYTLILGPQFARQDIRTDLPNADLLKTYPLAGWQVVLGQLLTPTLILSGVLWLTLLTVAFAFQPTRSSLVWLTPPLIFTATAALAVLTPVIVALQLLVPNAASLLFPGWIQVNRGRGGGIEVVGQRMIFFFAQLVAMVAALLPATALAALLIALLQWWMGAPWAVIAAAGATLGLLLLELSLGIWWLGRRFEHLDLSVELRP